MNNTNEPHCISIRYILLFLYSNMNSNLSLIRVKLGS